MKSIVSVLSLGLFFFSSLLFSGTVSAQNAIPSARPGVTYGKKTTANDAISVKALNDKMRADTTARFSGKVKGKIVDVCKSKGCYIRLEPQAGSEPITVRFKDYGYFLPQDAKGKTAVLEGQARIRNGEISIIADGVLIVN